MAKRCGPNRPCGMSQGIFNPFFQGGAQWFGSGGVSYSPADYGDNLVFWLDGSRASLMMQEQANTGVPITDVTADAQSIGLVYERGKHAYFLRADSDARRPILGSDANVNSYITFDGTDDYLRVVNTAKYFNAFHKASPIFSIAILARMGAGTDASSRYLFGSNTNTTANSGIRMERTTANRIAVSATKSSAGNAVFSFTSTPTFTVSSGFQWILLEVNGVGAGMGRLKVGSNAWETFTVNAGAATDATSDLFIGALNGPTAGTYFKGDIAQMIVLNRTLTSDDITNITAFNPTRSSAAYSAVQWDIDFDADARIFADTAGTTPITDGTGIRLIRHNQDSIFGPINRELTSAAAGSSPIWRDNHRNGQAYAEYDGVDDNLDFNVSLTQEAGGKWVDFVILKNDDATIGCNYLKGTGYQVCTGTNYSGNTLNNGNPYFLAHTSAGGGVPASPPATPKNGGEGYNIFVFRRVGSNWSSWGGDKVKRVGTDSGSHIMTDMGEQFNPNFWTNGMYGRCIKYNGEMSDAEVEAKIDELNAMYNI
jgi:hypothetical protein